MKNTEERKYVVMSSFFDMDSPFMRFLNKVADMVILNFVALICCIPIFTIGASLTALHYVCLKIARGEEGYIIRSFFKSFKLNFKQATAIWMMFLGMFAILFVDFWFLRGMEGTFSTVLLCILLIATAIILFTLTFVFPVLSKFDNTVWRTIKNAFFISILQLPRTIVMIVVNILPFVMLYYAKAAPFALLFGLSVPALLGGFLYDKFFAKLEGREETQGEAKEENIDEEADIQTETE